MPSYNKWDIRFLKLAREVSTWSKDPSTKTGAVIVRHDRTVCAVGFNGFPRYMPDRPELYENREEKYSRIVHCEMNALLHSFAPVIGYTLYTYPFASCDRCAVHMLQAGIARFVFPSLPPDKADRWKDSLVKTLQYFNECNVDYLEIPHDMF